MLVPVPRYPSTLKALKYWSLSPEVKLILTDKGEINCLEAKKLNVCIAVGQKKKRKKE